MDDVYNVGSDIPRKGLRVCEPLNILINEQRLTFWALDLAPDLAFQVILDAPGETAGADGGLVKAG
jgi:hypothetical protein